MPPSVCFGTGREHKLNLLCGLFGVSDCKWMSGPAGSRDQKPRGTGAQTEIPIKSIARSPERAQEPCAFLLTLTYIDGGYSLRIAGFSVLLASRVSEFRTGKPGRRRQASDARIPRVTTLRRRRAQTFAEAFKRVGRRDTDDVLHALVAELAGHAQAERTTERHREIAVVHS